MPLDDQGKSRILSGAEIGALAHLYRAEVYRSTIWRTRLDTTTNWAVVTLGVALSISFAAPEASAVPLLLVGVLVLLFLGLEARRYRYFNVWRARARWLEKHFYAPLLEDGDLRMNAGWQHVLADDLLHPNYHVSLLTALGRRIRRSYLWIVLIQALAYGLKIAVHPTPVQSVAELVARAKIGPFPGWVVIGIGIVYCVVFSALAIWSSRADARKFAGVDSASGMG